MKPYLLWLDLEMSGLDPKEHDIIEVGAVILDKKFEIMSKYHNVVHYDVAKHDGLDPTVLNMHSRNGLWTACLKSESNLARVDEQIWKWATSFFGIGLHHVKLGGNTLTADMPFIRLQMPNLSRIAAYGTFDLATVRDLAYQLGYAPVLREDSNHRALDDCLLDIKATKAYLKLFSGE